MSDRKPSAIGKVYLVGAGPGDPSLATLRAIDCLAQADVVLYDYLVNAELLRHAHPTAETICLGRHGQGRLWTQDEINDRLVKEAKAGKQVVRLKSGDPMIFGKATEELACLALHRIPNEVVPGITAALAAGSYAGVPITEGNLASAAAIVTGQERTEKNGSSIDFEALARFPGTLVFYMGVTSANHWTQRLIDAGKSADTPAAIVRRCSFSDQQTYRCSLEQVAQVIRTEHIRPPAIVILGKVAALPTGLSWFEQRPLCGVTVMVTRPAHQAERLGERLAGLGARVVYQPAIRISTPTDSSHLDAAIRRLDEFDWLVFCSSNGVRFFFDRLHALDLDARTLSSTRLAVVGPGTRDELKQFHLQADLMPAEHRAEALARELAPHVDGKQLLLVRASRGREVLADELTSSGAKVEQVIAYQSDDVTQIDPETEALLQRNAIDWVTVTSSAMARATVSLLQDYLGSFRIASISPLTSAALRECGCQADAEAKIYTSDGIVDAIGSSEQRT